MPWSSIPIVGPAYADDTKPWSSQDTVNFIPLLAEVANTRSPSLLRSAPGLDLFCDLGTGAPVRGVHNAESLLLVVSAQTLFKISAAGVATALGTIPGVGRVSMAHNQITGGNQIAISNGTSGYVYDTVAGTLTQITADAFVGSMAFDYIDSYIVGADPFGRFWFVSALADATSYSSLDEYEAEANPDLIVGILVSHEEVWVFGQKTIEVFIDTGDETTTFQRASGAVMEVGAAGTFSMQRLDNSVFWLGNDGVVYRATGYLPIRISTHPVEQAISRCNIAQVVTYVYEDRGHKIFYLTFPDGQTWGYDVATQMWHRRQSEGLSRWRVNTLTRWNGSWIAGDYTNGKLYKVNWNTQTENGATLERRRISGVLQNAQNRVLVNGIELVMNAGMPSSGQNSVDIRYSHDGGHNWSSWRKLPYGSTGGFSQRVTSRRFGIGRDWLFDIRITDSVNADILAASIMTEAASD